MSASPYRGRFAPSPSGPLHLGSLFCALVSFLDARHANGQWLVRIEDLDPPREQPGADSLILQTLEAHGLEWDGPVLYQSTRHEHYQAAIEQLLASGHAYPCACSRQSLRTRNGIHEGRCKAPAPGTPCAIRVDVNGHVVTFTDRLYGLQTDRLKDHGDFIIRRKDGLHAYQLAVVIDDAEQQITDVVRGDDLLDSTGRQIYLQQLLQLPAVRYLHHPLVVDTQGNKLSKQRFAPAVNNRNASENLSTLLAAMGLKVPDSLHSAPPAELLSWARLHWSKHTLQAGQRIPAAGPDSGTRQ